MWGKEGNQSHQAFYSANLPVKVRDKQEIFVPKGQKTRARKGRCKGADEVKRVIQKN